MSALDWLALAVGLLIVSLTLYDVFSSVVVPRSVSPALRPSAQIVRQGWRLWRFFGLRIEDEDRREDFLGRYAPGMLVLLLVVWLVGFLIGYGLIFYAVRIHTQPPIHSFIDAVYFAGTSMLTIGYGDIVATGNLTRLLTLAAAATGLTLFALLISFIFSIFGSFQRREVFVVKMGSRAGAPPSGTTLLETVAKLKIMEDFSQIIHEAEDWAAFVLESHLAYPILMFFRSSHDDESFMGTLGALLDASTILITTTDSPLAGRASLLSLVGVHAVRDLAHYFNFAEGTEVGIERAEFDQACATLSAAGWQIQHDDASWDRFSRYRMKYAGTLNEMARWWAIPPSRWIGDRAAIGSHAMHSRSVDSQARAR